jgi:hypothetical protein
MTPATSCRNYSADQIAALSKLSSNTIEELVRFGLLDPREGLFGFHDLAGARQISKLFEHGIALSEIIRSVKEVRAWRELRKYSPAGDGIFVPIFAGLKFKANTFGASEVASLDRVDEVTKERKGRYALQTREAARA